MFERDQTIEFRLQPSRGMLEQGLPGLRVWRVEQPGSRTGRGGRVPGASREAHTQSRRALGVWGWELAAGLSAPATLTPLPHAATTPCLWRRRTGMLQAWALRQPLCSQDCGGLRSRAQYCSSLPMPFRTTTFRLTARTREGAESDSHFKLWCLISVTTEGVCQLTWVQSEASGSASVWTVGPLLSFWGSGSVLVIWFTGAAAVWPAVSAPNSLH